MKSNGGCGAARQFQAYPERDLPMSGGHPGVYSGNIVPIKIIELLNGHLAALQAEAAVTYGPIVEGLINSRCKDPAEIQRTLDGLLDSCGNPAVLQLFKKLCRYYYYLDAEATAAYIGFYLEQWEPERYKKIIKEQKKKK